MAKLMKYRSKGNPTPELGIGAARQPVTTLDDLNGLDQDEIIEGYRDGLNCEPEPGGNRSRSYWHGWCNGMVDAGHMEKTEGQAILAHNHLKAQRNDR